MGYIVSCECMWEGVVYSIQRLRGVHSIPIYYLGGIGHCERERREKSARDSR
jgi:hypothetical protein